MSSTTNTTNPVFAAEETSKMNLLKWQLGENGSPQLSEYGLCSKSGTPEYVGALCALSNKLVRGTSNKRPISKGKGHHSNSSHIGCDLDQIQHLFQNVMIAWTKAGPDRADARAVASQVVEDLIIMMFNLRDVRGTYGRGERTLSYWMFMFLYKLRSKPMHVFLREFPNYGGWMDINNLYEMTFEDKWIKYLTSEKINKLRDQLALTYAIQLVKDLTMLNSGNGEKVSLAAKWCPKEGRSLDKRTRMGKHIARLLYPDLWKVDFKSALKNYRTHLSKLCANLDVVERKMASIKHEWSKIDFDKMPGRAMAKRTKAWANQTKKGEIRSSSEDRVTCAQNYQNYLCSLGSGKKTAKGKVMFVHELAQKLVDLQTNYSQGGSSVKDRTLYESMMDAHINSIAEEMKKNESNNLGNTAIIADVSGSMAGDPMAVSYAMAVIASHPLIASPAWQNIVMTFSEKPEWIRLQYPATHTEWVATQYGRLLQKEWCQEDAGRQLTWSEKLCVVKNMPWGTNTNFISALNLVATRAIEAGVAMPNILCISDMQWDRASYHNPSYCQYGESNISAPLTYGPLFNFSIRNLDSSPTTLLREVKKRLASEPCGNKFTTVLWNVRGQTEGHPCAADEDNFIEVAGFSTNMLKVFLNEGILNTPTSSTEGATSWSTLRSMLDHENYDRIRELTNLLKPWRNTDIRPLSSAEMSLLPDMYIPQSWRDTHDNQSTPIRPNPQPGMSPDFLPPKLKRSVATGYNADYTVVDYSKFDNSQPSYASACSANNQVVNMVYDESASKTFSMKTPFNTPDNLSPPEIPPQQSTPQDSVALLNSRMEALEKRLEQVTAERDNLIKSSVTQSSQDSYDIHEMKKMMEQLLAKTQSS